VCEEQVGTLKDTVEHESVLPLSGVWGGCPQTPAPHCWRICLYVDLLTPWPEEMPPGDS
jgi:hypothetical protein